MGVEMGTQIPMGASIGISHGTNGGSGTSPTKFLLVCLQLSTVGYNSHWLLTIYFTNTLNCSLYCTETKTETRYPFKCHNW